MAFMAEGHDLAGAVVFTILVTMKHLFACLGPLYAVYLLRHYCRCVGSLRPPPPPPPLPLDVLYMHACTHVHVPSHPDTCIVGLLSC